MKIRIIRVFAVLGVITVLTAGCGQGASSDQEADASQGAGSTVEGMIRILPYDSRGFAYSDFELIRTDPDLEDVYNEFLSYGMEDSLSEKMGLRLNDLNIIVSAVSEDWDRWGIITGDFNINNFRYAMDYNGYDEDEYRGEEVWSDGSEAYAVIDDMIVFCDNSDRIQDVINLSIGGGTSAYEYEDFADVLERIPPGIIIVLIGSELYQYEKYICAGMTYSKVSGADDILKLNACFKYGSAQEAEDDMDELEDDIVSYLNLYAFDVRQSGEFITIEGKFDMVDIRLPDF